MIMLEIVEHLLCNSSALSILWLRTLVVEGSSPKPDIKIKYKKKKISSKKSGE